MKKRDMKDLIEKAKGFLKNMGEDDPSYEILNGYIKEAENTLSDIKGNFTSSQEEVYKKLEAAVGPWKRIILLYYCPCLFSRAFFYFTLFSTTPRHSRPDWESSLLCMYSRFRENDVKNEEREWGWDKNIDFGPVFLTLKKLPD